MYESEFKNVKNGVMVYAAMPVSQHDWKLHPLVTTSAEIS
jgi:hypothetical protein